MIKPFEYYLKENLVRKSFPNISMAKSLLQKAEIRLKRINAAKIEENESSIVFEELYECLRESAQSLMEINGYKPYSHEALISFINQQKFLSEYETNIFDNYRILRNNSVYKAEKVSLQICLEALEFAKQTLPKLNNKFKELIKINK